MREPLKDRDRLIHIKDSIERIEEGVNNDFVFVENSLTYFGIVKLIEIIGEAVYMLSLEFKDNHPATPWRKIERMRHVLVHGYYTVSIDLIKEVVNSDLPTLKTQIVEYIEHSDFS